MIMVEIGVIDEWGFKVTSEISFSFPVVNNSLPEPRPSRMNP
jgi:hypothetical protein